MLLGASKLPIIKAFPSSSAACQKFLHALTPEMQTGTRNRRGQATLSAPSSDALVLLFLRKCILYFNKLRQFGTPLVATPTRHRTTPLSRLRQPRHPARCVGGLYRVGRTTRSLTTDMVSPALTHAVLVRPHLSSVTYLVHRSICSGPMSPDTV